MPRIAILSDTHVPSRATAIPDWVLDVVADADHVVHAGDFDSPEAYETVQSHATDLTAVVGNVDPQSIDLPAVATLDVGGVRFVVTHGTGPKTGYRERVLGAGRDHDGDVVVSGHTHEVVDQDHDGLRLLNPGSATGARPATQTTMYEATVEDGTVDVTLRTT
ncbi:metallophosphoesterase family protein [Haloarchaeobius sp. HRN-SO-5]|uniref:metallophosphoesterase family protein n=1 Tax=Haloarchaeobius sp. HRN-SO-5 TaxID=3446118 RepID=UPI003EBDBA27